MKTLLNKKSFLEKKSLSIVIPVFNEEKRLQKTFEALTTLPHFSGLNLYEVIFVNDGSTDKTLSKIKNFIKVNKKLPLSVISYTQNQGKGFAVRKGMLASGADYVLLCDADMSTPFSELEKFETHVLSGGDIVIGTRKNGKSTVIVHQPKIRELLGKGFTLFTQKSLRLSVSDFTCGFKLFNQLSAKTIFSKAIINRWGYDAEALYIAKKYNLVISECSVAWSDDRGTHVNLFTAVPQTIIEIVKIILFHDLLPFVRQFSTVSFSRISKIFS